MSRRASPTTIGLFVIGALVIAIVGVGVFASRSMFRTQTTFISYFDESVNGLDVGAPVKFKGVPIGQVAAIEVRLDLDDETFQVPVLYEIDLQPLTNMTGQSVNLANPRVLQRQIDEGLRAQLQMESLLTGKLYIELTFVEDPQRPVLVADDRGYPAIPTVLSPMGRLGEEASGLVSNLRRFDVNTINENLIELLVKANAKIDQLDMTAINDSVLVAVSSVRSLAEAPEIRQALDDVPRIAQRLDSTLADVQSLAHSLEGAVDPTTESLNKTTEEMIVTLEVLQETMSDTRAMLSTDSGLGYQIEDALTNLSEAAEALRVLSVSLERDPSMFIRGKEPPEEEEGTP
ncbi:paraquat-inducible protein B [Longibacter salinarum]|uniref:Paraquat-inducible protein B n=1 Tax=Longibacter salinarum TaxID=1850348 RepID=A0A2A8CW18_9BACT|nr:MlaD family protein [Longibacter salinarum]PEN12588.1 paraquat-inducible protein B [Longibacter salinarum]